MKKALCFLAIACLLLSASACVHRMAPFSPHRTNTDFHKDAKTNETCMECHQLAEIGHEHKATDNCLRCHRIVQGD